MSQVFTSLSIQKTILSSNPTHICKANTTIIITLVYIHNNYNEVIFATVITLFITIFLQFYFIHVHDPVLGTERKWIEKKRNTTQFSSATFLQERKEQQKKMKTKTKFYTHRGKYIIDTHI